MTGARNNDASAGESAGEPSSEPAVHEDPEKLGRKKPETKGPPSHRVVANMSLTAAEFRKVLGQFATGVTVVTVARESGQVHGMTANAFASVSLEPLLVLVCVDRRARTHPLIHARKRFGVNVLAEQQEALARYFAQPDQDHETAERLGVAYRRTERGTPVLEGSLAHLECSLVSAHEAGDHTIFLGAVEGAESREGRPLLFFAGKYHRLPKKMH